MFARGSAQCVTEVADSVVHQQVRTVRLRKLPWFPRAKTKMFRVPPTYKQDESEKVYISPIIQLYKAQMRSIYQLFKTEGKFSDTLSLVAIEETRRRAEIERRLRERNEERNRRILEHQLVDDERQLVEKIADAEREFHKQRELISTFEAEANERVRKMKEKVKSFIDPNNLEQEIEKALDERHTHCFAIDVRGNFYKNNVLVTPAQAFDIHYIPEASELAADQSSQLREQSNATMKAMADEASSEPVAPQ